jgi:RND family efflux transporter MFP subunit
MSDKHLTPRWMAWRDAVAQGALALLAGASLPALAQQPLGCLIEPDHAADVGSQLVGVIEAMHVERGQLVRRGQVIATLRADVERAVLGVAKSRAEATADIQAAAAGAAFARSRMARAKDLLSKQFISDQGYDQIRTESEVAEQKLAQAQEQHRLAQREFELAKSQLEMRTVRSPLDGIIVERYMAPGERVEDKPIARVAVVDPLRVQVVAPSTLYGQVRADATASIVPELNGATPRTARVILVDKMLDAASNTFRITLALPNPGNALPAGLRCRADFGLGGATKAAGGGKPAPAPAAKPAPAATPPVNR